MGFYVNAGKKEKEEFLAENAEEVQEIWDAVWPPPPGKAVICLVQNDGFNAAAVCYNQDEFWAFADPGDQRPKRWFLLDKKLAMQHSGIPESMFC